MLRSDEMKQEISNLQNSAKDLMNKEGVTSQELEDIQNKIKIAKNKLALQLDLEAAEKEEAQNKVNPLEKHVAPNPLNLEDKKAKANESLIFAKAITGLATPEEINEFRNLIQEGVDENGGYLVPADVSTRLIELQRNKFDIRKYVDIEKTGVLKGSRPKQKNEPQASGFASVDEGAEIQKLHEPIIEQVEYTVRKYAGYIPISNELLADSPENILGFIIKWLAKNELNTYAYQVFKGTGVKSAEGIMTNTAAGKKLESRVKKMTTKPGINDFKTIFNVDLDEIGIDEMAIYTNAVGYNYLDSLVDGNGKSHIQPDATKKSGYVFLGREIVKVPSKFLSDVTEETNVFSPFIIGNLKALYTLYDRKQLTVESSKIGGEAWRKDILETKGIFRFDGRINGDIKAVKILLAKLG